MPTHALDPHLDGLRREFDAACQQAANRARSEQLQILNQLFRRFRAYQTESDWVQTTIDAASSFASNVAVFSITSDTLKLRGQSPADLLPNDLSFPLSAAAAFANAIESKDPVTTLRNPSEVSSALSAGHDGQRAHIFPIANGNRISAILFASDTDSDMNALELIAGIASSVLERKSNQNLHAQITRAVAPAEPEPFLEPEAPAQPVTVILPPLPVPPPVPAEPSVPQKAFAPSSIYRSLTPPSFSQPVLQTLPTETRLPAWTDLPMDQRQLHIRAQRFARVAIAELQLARPEACRAGREQNDLYLFLKREIDKARENYRKQFMTVPSMVDYLHLELIQTAAQGDEHKLGADYPGRLI